MGRRPARDEELAARLEAARVAAGLTRPQLARLLPNREERWVYDVERAHQGIHWRDILEFAGALDVRVGSLLGEEDAAEPTEFEQRVRALEPFLDTRAACGLVVRDSPRDDGFG